MLIAAALAFPAPCPAAVLYKNYEVHQAFGEDVLCDPYVVQRGDHIMELFRLRGQISEKDFPEFLRIFRALNPRVRDVDRIYPGQFLLIPLKKAPPGSLPEQETGSVTLPLVTSREAPPAPPAPREPRTGGFVEYVVRYGDTVSTILADRFGRLGSPPYTQALRRFRDLNPNLEDLNRIFVGQRLVLPGASPDQAPAGGVEALDGQGWSPPLADKGAGEAKFQEAALGPSSPAAARPAPLQAAPERDPVKLLQPLAPVISAMGGMLMDKGVYYFPRSGRRDLELDLEKHPVLRLPDGRFALLGGSRGLSREEIQAMRRMWGRVEVFNLPEGAAPDAALSRVLARSGLKPQKSEIAFADGDIEVRVACHMVLPGQGQFQYVAVTWIDSQDQATSEPLQAYLAENAVRIADIVRNPGPNPGGGAPPAARSTPRRWLAPEWSPRVFVAAFMKALGLDYEENVPFSFPYAGFEVETVVNRLRLPGGRELLLDFGSMGGQAHETLRALGHEVMIVPRERDWVVGARNLAERLGLQYQWDPVFFGADRPENSCASLIAPGLKVQGPGPEHVLVTDEPLHDKVAAFLLEKGAGVLQIQAFEKINGKTKNTETAFP